MLATCAPSGTIETVALRIPEGQIVVNADATGGTVKVEVLVPDGRVQPGFSADHCCPLADGQIHHTGHWNGVDLSDAEQPLCLRFRLHRAKIYSFRVIQNGPDGR